MPDRLPGLKTTRTVHEAQHAGTLEDRLEINRFFVRQMALLLGKLDAVDVGEGRSLLDDTLVVMGSEMAVGGHWNDPIPYILAGGGSRHFKLGRLYKARGLTRHTQLLTSIAHSMGLPDVASFSEFTGEDSLGALPGLEGRGRSAKFSQEGCGGCGG